MAQAFLSRPGGPRKGARCLLQPFLSVDMSTRRQKRPRIYVGFVQLAEIWRAKGAFEGNAGPQRATSDFFLVAMYVDHDACVAILV